MPVTPSQLNNAEQDVITLGQVVNGAADLNGDGTITNREGADLKTLAKLEAEFQAKIDEQTVQEQEAAASAAEAAASEAAAESLVGPSYASAAAGLAATTDGQFFAVNGAGIVTIYLNDGGSAVVQRTLATSSALAAPSGSDLVGERTVAQLLASTTPARGAGALWRAGGFSYQEAASSATDHHLTTAGGVKLYVLPNSAGEYNSDALGLSVATNLQALVANRAAGQIVTGTQNFTLTTNVAVPEGVSFLMDGIITMNGGKLTFGTAASFLQRPARYRLNLVRQTHSDYSTLNDVGAEFINVANSDIFIGRVEGFAIGVKGVGDGVDRGFAWNTVTIHRANHCLIIFDADIRNGGFVNQNSFFSNHAVQRNTVATSATTLPEFVNASSEIECYLYRLAGVNGNTFYHPSIEYNFTRSADGQVFRGSGFYVVGNAVMNRSFSARFEASQVVARIVASGARDNLFDILYSDPGTGNPVLDDRSSRRTNLLRYMDDYIINENQGQWHSGPIYERTTSLNGASFCIPGCSFAITTVHASPVINSGNAGWRALKSYVQAASNLNICVRVDTARQKRFVLKRDVVAGFGGRVVFSARKADGSIWTNSDPGAPYIFCDRTVAYNNQVFGGWVTQADFDGDIFFEAHPDVDHVIIGMAGGTNVLRLKSFSIVSVEGGTPTVTSGNPQWVGNVRISEISPIVGYYSQGDVVQNRNAAAGQTIGWKASIGGWAAQTAWAGSTAYAVDDIIHNGGNAYQCVTAGTSASSGGPTGTGLGISDGTVVWDYIAPRAPFRALPVMP